MKHASRRVKESRPNKPGTHKEASCSEIDIWVTMAVDINILSRCRTGHKLRLSPIHLFNRLNPLFLRLNRELASKLLSIGASHAQRNKCSRVPRSVTDP